MEPSPAEPNLGAGVAAGLLAGVVGAIVWGGFTALTHFRIGYLAVGVGFLVAYAITRYGRVRSTGLGVTAAVITLLACAAGDTGSIYFQAAHDLHTSVSTLMQATGPVTVFREDITHDKFGLIFFAIGAWAAFRYVTWGGRSRLRSGGYAPRTSYAPPQGPPPAYGQPSYGPPTGQPTYGQPPAGPPTYGPLPVPPTYEPPPVPPTYEPPAGDPPGVGSPPPTS